MAGSLRLVSKEARLWAAAACALIGATACERVSLPFAWRKKPSATDSATLKAHSELLSEMYRVVLGERPTSEEFSSLLDSLEQGASLEGIYNGIAHSARYRALEQANPGSSSKALERFSVEMVELQKAMTAPIQFDESYARPLARMEVGAEGQQDGVHVQAFPGAKKKFPGQKPAGAPSQDLKNIFRGASIYTLKRVLGDQALLILAARRTDPEGRASWYGTWAAGVAERGGDFGLSQRESKDSAFHSQWARTAGEDRITWEVLNRLHRVMNESLPGSGGRK